MTDKLTFVHLTDLHIGNPEVPDASLQTDTAATLRAVLADVQRLRPAPSFMVVSGDLTNRGDAGSYAAVQTIFADAGLSMPVLFALGNHDNRAEFYRTMLGRADQGRAHYDHDTVIAGLQIVVLDTSVPGRIGGGLEPSQFDWLAVRLDADPKLQKLLVMHHAPMLDEDDASTAWESIGAANTARLRGLLAGRRDVVGILSGHIHYDRVSNWHGIPLVVGTGLHNATDVPALGTSHRSLAGASFAVGTVRPSGLTVAFAPQPSDRRELGNLSPAALGDLIRRFDGEA